MSVCELCGRRSWCAWTKEWSSNKWGSLITDFLVQLLALRLGGYITIKSDPLQLLSWSEFITCSYVFYVYSYFISSSLMNNYNSSNVSFFVFHFLIYVWVSSFATVLFLTQLTGRALTLIDYQIYNDSPSWTCYLNPLNGSYSNQNI